MTEHDLRALDDMIEEQIERAAELRDQGRRAIAFLVGVGRGCSLGSFLDGEYCDDDF